MSTLTAELERGSFAARPLRTGLALAITVAVFYTLCTFAWLSAQAPFLGFMNSLFHGIDFTSLVTPAPFSWRGFLEALLVMSIWAFLAGTFFGWVRQRLES
jgi:hypothetical protein